MPNHLSHKVWVAAYATEQARQENATAGRRIRRAGCVVVLCFFRTIGRLL